jgi:hypothetical protein
VALDVDERPGSTRRRRKRPRATKARRRLIYNCPGMMGVFKNLLEKGDLWR